MPQADPIVISGVAAVCAVGHTAPMAFTSVKASLARIGESNELVIEDFKKRRLGVKCAAAQGVTDGQRRFLRMSRLALRAFTEVLAHARFDAATLSATPIHVAFAEAERPGHDERCEQLLMRHIAAAIGVPDLKRQTTPVSIGHAGAAVALGRAVQSIAAGESPSAIVGGVDGYLDEMSLQWLYDVDRLKTDDNPKGFIPGEAAAFFVVERESNAIQRNAGRYARVAGTGQAFEPKNYYEKSPCTGVGLTQAIRVACEACDLPPEISLVLCDLNGERHRANEWGLALSRCFPGDLPAPVLWHPADVLGDTGAASGALNVVFATLALARGHAGSHALVWAASDDGERGAAVLCRPSAPRAQRGRFTWV